MKRCDEFCIAYNEISSIVSKHVQFKTFSYSTDSHNNYWLFLIDYTVSSSQPTETKATDERGDEVVATPEEEKKEEEEAKEPEAAGAAPVVEEKGEAKKSTGGIFSGMSDDKPHTSVKVRAPPGGKSSITF